MKLEKPLNKMTQEERRLFLRSSDGRIMMEEIKQIIKSTKKRYKEVSDITIGNKIYKFMLFHTDIAEDLIHNIKFLELVKENDYYISETLEFLEDYYSVDKIDRFYACTLYYLKSEKKIIFSCIEKELEEEIEGCPLGEYYGRDNELIEYFEKLPDKIEFFI